MAVLGLGGQTRARRKCTGSGSRQVTWEKYRDAARLYRDGVRKDKVQLKLNTARGGKKDKKGICRYLS